MTADSTFRDLTCADVENGLSGCEERHLFKQLGFLSTKLSICGLARCG